MQLSVIRPNRGFDLEAAHCAIARIECPQEWEREPTDVSSFIKIVDLWISARVKQELQQSCLRPARR